MDSQSIAHTKKWKHVRHGRLEHVKTRMIGDVLVTSRGFRFRKNRKHVDLYALIVKGQK